MVSLVLSVEGLVVKKSGQQKEKDERENEDERAKKIAYFEKFP
jgi:hypothetical protein